MTSPKRSGIVEGRDARGGGGKRGGDGGGDGDGGKRGGEGGGSGGGGAGQVETVPGPETPSVRVVGQKQTAVPCLA